KRALDAAKDRAVDPGVLFFVHGRAYCCTREESHVWEMLRLTQEQANASKRSLCYTYLGSLHWYRGDLEQACAYLEEALNHARQINMEAGVDRQWEEDGHVLQILLKQGQIAWAQGRLADAERQLQASLAICDARHYDPANMCRSSEGLGMAAIARRDYAR